MFGVLPRGQTRDNSNTRFCTLKRNTYMCSYIISVVYLYIYPIISCLKGFALFYHIQHTWNAYVARSLLEIKNGKMKHAYNKDKTRLIILKR